MSPQGNNDSPKKCYKVKGSKYLQANNDSLETITVKSELGKIIRIPVNDLNQRNCIHWETWLLFHKILEFG